MRKILIVEDEDLLRESYRIIISTEPYDVDIAKNGQEALDKCAEKTYDLILLDLMMPVLDGLGFLERFDNPGTKIIVLSNLSSGEVLEQALKLGAESNVVKATLSPRELLSKVRYEVTTITPSPS
jgi:DNA-binding response OmpR family regulator